MKRLFYLATGAAIGVVSMRRAARAARAWTPDGLAGRAVVLGGTLRDFGEDVRAGMVERERELHEALCLDNDDRDDVRN